MKKERNVMWQECKKTNSAKAELKIAKGGTCLAVQWLRLHASTAGVTCSIPGQGTRSHMLQLRPGAAK